MMHWEVWKLQEEISKSVSWSTHGTWPDLVRFQKIPIFLVQSVCTKFLIKSNRIHSHAKQTRQDKFVRMFVGGWLDLVGRGWLWSLLTCWPAALQRAACLVSPPLPPPPLPLLLPTLTAPQTSTLLPLTPHPATQASISSRSDALTWHNSRSQLWVTRKTGRLQAGPVSKADWAPPGKAELRAQWRTSASTSTLVLYIHYVQRAFGWRWPPWQDTPPPPPLPHLLSYLCPLVEHPFKCYPDTKTTDMVTSLMLTST